MYPKVLHYEVGDGVDALKKVMVLLVITRTALYTARLIMMMVMPVVTALMTMRTVIAPMTILMFEVVRLILSGCDNDVDGNGAGDSDNAGDDVGDSDKNVLVIVAMTTVKTMVVTMALVSLLFLVVDHLRVQLKFHGQF